MPVTTCLVCGADTHGTPRCDEHKLRYSNRTPKGDYRSTNRWKKQSKAMRTLAPFCEWCCTTENLGTDHIIPLAEDPSLAYEPLNLRVLCNACNARRRNNVTDEERAQVLAAIARRKQRQTAI